MSRKTSDEERIIHYFENASVDSAQTALNIIKAILKRKNTSEQPSKLRGRTNSQRKSTPPNRAPAAMREVPETNHGTAGHLS